MRKKNIMLISFLTLGYPKLAYTKQMVNALIDGGSDIIELGIPFSDPIADGPVIQYSSQKALEHDTNTDRCLNEIGKLEVTKPIIILTYYNIVYRYGIERFVKRASGANVWGILVADLPIEEAQEYIRACRKYKVKTIFIVAPNTEKERIRKIAAKTTGFLYLMAHFGVTGTKSSLEDVTLKAVKRIMAVTRVPVCVGFGISKPEHVELLAKTGAKGAIVGSAYIKEIRKGGSLKRIADRLKGMSEKLKSLV